MVNPIPNPIPNPKCYYSPNLFKVVSHPTVSWLVLGLADRQSLNYVTELVTAVLTSLGGMTKYRVDRIDRVDRLIAASTVAQ